MSQTTSFTRVKARLHESATGAAGVVFWTDTAIYSYLDAGQLAVIDFFLNQREYIKRLDPNYEPKVLIPLITVNTFNLVTGTAEYDVDAAANNYRATIGATVKYNVPTNTTRATYMPLLKTQWRSGNTYQAGTVTAAYYYISGSNIGFVPTPDANVSSGGVHTYYKTPATVTASQDFTLTGETHLAIEAYALYNAFMEDNKPNEANQAFTEFLNYLKELS